ncbi:hypothetical protein D3C72_1524870 [compost metagenome]
MMPEPAFEMMPEPAFEMMFEPTRPAGPLATPSMRAEPEASSSRPAVVPPGRWVTPKSPTPLVPFGWVQAATDSASNTAVAVVSWRREVARVAIDISFPRMGVLRELYPRLGPFLLPLVAVGGGFLYNGAPPKRAF